MPKLIIKGGSAAEPSRNANSPFFHAGVKAIELRNKEQYQLRILPAFDRGIPVDDPSFATSYVAYRDNNLEQEALTHTPGFTDWYFTFSGYSFLGRQSRSFLSQASLFQGSIDPGYDPVHDCYRYAKRSEDPAIKALTERPKDQKSHAVIPSVRRWAFVNAYVDTNNSGVWENKIVYFSSMSMEDLKKKLALRAGRNDAIVSPDWPDFVFGDITDPLGGLLAKVRKARPYDNTQGIETPCLFFSNQPGTLVGANTWPIDPATEEGRAVLYGRYDLSDSEKVTKIASYEALLDYIVQDGTIPYEIIAAACGAYADVPAEPPSAREATYSAPPPEVVDEDQVPGVEMDPLSAPAPKAVPARPAPARPAPLPVPARPAPARPAPLPTPARPAPAKPVAAPAKPETKPAPRPVPTAKVTPALTQDAYIDPADPEIPSSGEAPTAAEKALWDALMLKSANNEELTDEDFRNLAVLSPKCN